MVFSVFISVSPCLRGSSFFRTMTKRFESWGWTASQRGFLIVALSLLTAFVAFRLSRDRQFVPNPLPAVGPRASELDWKIDLNTADATTLAAVPRLGESKAKAIVDYRAQFESAHPGRRAYEHLEDLFHVKGIGGGTVMMLKPFVTIESTTKPSPRP